MTGIRRALVLADGAPATRSQLDAAWPGWDEDVDLVVAADGGARLADALGLRIDRWVGDGDSLGPDGVAELRRRGVDVDLQPTDKDATDLELALEAALAAGARLVVILGALGVPRPDHALANVALRAPSRHLTCVWYTCVSAGAVLVAGAIAIVAVALVALASVSMLFTVIA